MDWEVRICYSVRLSRFLYVECLLNLFDPREIFRMWCGILPGASHPQKVIDSHTVKKLPPKPKNFPQEHPRQIKRTKFSLCKGGCCWGKFWGGQGGLEGRRPSAKEGLLRLQGLPHPSKVFFSPLQYLPVNGNRYDLPRDELSAGAESRLCRLLQAAATGNFHPNDGQRADVVF